MKLSEQKRQILYNAISEEIVNLRIKLLKENTYVYIKTLDNLLFDLENDIWKNVKKALRIQT